MGLRSRWWGPQAPTGTSGNTRKRDLIVYTDPVFDDLEITSITKERLSDNYGHHHSANNSLILCRGASSADNGFTDEDGTFEFFYRGPEAAGKTKVTVNWKDARDNETGSVSLTFTNSHDGMTTIPSATGVELVGFDSNHIQGETHYVTSTTRTNILNICYDYYDEYSEDVRVNDASLKHGGLFDFDIPWSTPHSEHREGKNVDMRPHWAGTTTHWTKLKTLVTTYGGTYVEHTAPGQHLHYRQN